MPSISSYYLKGPLAPDGKPREGKPREKDKRYRVRYRKPDHSQTDKRGFKTKREAELFAASIEVAKATGEYIDVRITRDHCHAGRCVAYRAEPPQALVAAAGRDRVAALRRAEVGTRPDRHGPAQ